MVNILSFLTVLGLLRLLDALVKTRKHHTGTVSKQMNWPDLVLAARLGGSFLPAGGWPDLRRTRREKLRCSRKVDLETWERPQEALASRQEGDLDSAVRAGWDFGP